ncbi:MAG: hypothetical protein NZ805_13135 [Armatimonadetes bacterium]|nr:hypothetical protein [Armatimonadota bacterium]MDW8028614.1 hypothetical protein [Armatimonadota bacterium]
MRCSFVLVLICVAIAFSGAQETPPILKGRVFAPDGTPVRNREGKLNLRFDVLSQERHFVYPSDFYTTFKTDSEGLFEVRQRSDLSYLEQERLKIFEKEKGKRALAWVYLFVPEVGALMTRRFFWTVGEPFPDLHLKPLARLKVELFCPVLKIPINGNKQVRRADDAYSEWDTEWVPANEWLTVAEVSVKLQPGEEKHLSVPVMPPSSLPVYLQVQQSPYAGQIEFRKEPLPPLPIGGNLLSGYYGYWKGWTVVDLQEPYQFAFVPPAHLLRIPVERLEMQPLFRKAPSLDYLQTMPITEVECEIAEGTNAEQIAWNAFWLKPSIQEKLKEIIWRILSFFPDSTKSLSEDLRSLMPQPVREGLSNWLAKGRMMVGREEFLGSGRTCKLWVTKWTPVVVKAAVKVADDVYLIPIPVKGTEGIIRKRFTVKFQPPKREPPKIARLGKGRLEGAVQTPDGKPVAEVSVFADFAENELVERLSEEKDNTWFLTETDEQGRFVFPELPEGKYDVGLLSHDWVGCAEAVIVANKTTKVKLVALKSQIEEQKPQKRRINLQFLFPDGKPVAGYVFSASPSARVSPHEGLTDDQGCVSLEVEHRWLDIFLRSGYQDLLGTFTLQVPKDQSKIVVTVPIPLKGMVEGKVMLPDGSTSDKVIVTVWKLMPSRWGYTHLWLVHRLRILPNGRFFCSLPEGNYVFRAEPMPSEYYRQIDGAPSLSPPVIVKAGEVAKVEWKLKPFADCNLEIAYPHFKWPPPTLATLHIRTERYDGQVYESKFDLPMSLLRSVILEPLVELDKDEKVLWDSDIAPGFYKLTSWGWQGEEFNAVVRISPKIERFVLTPPSALPRLTVTGQVLLPNNEPASKAIVALYDPDQKMKRWATICDENGKFSLSVQLPSPSILERQNLDTFLPNSKGELWLIAWKIGYGHSLIRRLPRPRYEDENKTVNVGSLVLSRPERLEGQVVDENGKPVPFVGIVMLPIDTNLFEPKPEKETLMCELTAFENFNVGSIPHAQADINGRFSVEGLRRGQYLLVSQIRFWEDEQWKEMVAYHFVNIPRDKVTVRLERLKGTLNASPSDLTDALPFALAEVWMPCWRQIEFRFKADELGRFEISSIPNFEGIPMLVRIMHRDGMVISFNPPKDWRYVVQMRP